MKERKKESRYRLTKLNYQLTCLQVSVLDLHPLDEPPEKGKRERKSKKSADDEDDDYKPEA